MIMDPVSRAIANAPLDDEPLSAEDAVALGEAREWSRHNDPFSHEQVLSELGITQEEVNNHQD